jgi:hypothetical protein
MNSISEFDNGLDDLDYNWDSKSNDSDNSISYEAPYVNKVAQKAAPKAESMSGLKARVDDVKSSWDNISNDSDNSYSYQAPAKKTQITKKVTKKREVVSEYDNDFDDLNKNWDNISNDSDNSISYEAPPAKKLKVVKKVTKKKVVDETNSTAVPPTSTRPTIKNKSSVTGKEKKSDSVELRPASQDEPVTKRKDVVKSSNTGESSVPLDEFNLSESTIKHLNDRGIDSLFPIQAQTYWPIRNGRDLIGRARTGQGIQHLRFIAFQAL